MQGPPVGRYLPYLFSFRQLVNSVSYQIPVSESNHGTPRALLCLTFERPNKRLQTVDVQLPAALTFVRCNCLWQCNYKSQYNLQQRWTTNDGCSVQNIAKLPTFWSVATSLGFFHFRTERNVNTVPSMALDDVNLLFRPLSKLCSHFHSCKEIRKSESSPCWGLLGPEEL